jgi:hypothetical protein
MSLSAFNDSTWASNKLIVCSHWLWGLMGKFFFTYINSCFSSKFSSSFSFSYIYKILVTPYSDFSWIISFSFDINLSSNFAIYLSLSAIILLHCKWQSSWANLLADPTPLGRSEIVKCERSGLLRSSLTLASRNSILSSSSYYLVLVLGL